MTPIDDALHLARELILLRQAAEAEVRATQALDPSRPLTAFEKECIRTAFKGGAAFGAGRSRSTSDVNPLGLQLSSKCCKCGEPATIHGARSYCRDHDPDMGLSV